MSPWRRILLFGLCSLAGVLAPPASPGRGLPHTYAAEAADPGQPSLSGESAWVKVIENTIVGTTPDGPYTDYIEANGTVRHLDRDGAMRGRWERREDGQICFRFPEDEDSDCRRVELQGQTGAFIDSDGTRYRFDVLPGNARNL